MKNLKIIVAGLALLAGSGRAVAQNETDALRYSQLMFGGTARIQGLAGAQTALGADASTMSGNPAGMGLYRKSEFTFTPGLTFNETESTSGGIQLPDSRNNFNLSQMGIVFADRKADEVTNKWRGGAFGIGFTRINDFQNRTSFEGTVADKNSWLQALDDNLTNFNITQAELDAEYGFNGDNITSLEGLAYATFLIDTIPGTNGVLDVPGRAGSIKQRESIFSKGAQNQWDFSYGASYLDKLYVGGSVGFTTVRYEQERIYQEDAGPEEPYFSSLTLNDYFRTKGAGINLKVGLIYKPVDALRLGASIQTPTFMGLSDDYTTSLAVSYKEKAVSEGIVPNSNMSAQTLDGTFEYELTTPFRANGGIAAFIGKYGFISADVEFVNYPNARFRISDDNPYGLDPGTGYFQQQNSRIISSYDGAVNYRFGGEARFDVFRVRLGFAHYGDPFKNSNLDRAKTFITGGIGIKEKKFFVDAAYVHTGYNTYYSPYVLNDNSQPLVSTKNQNANFVVTAGFNF